MAIVVVQEMQAIVRKTSFALYTDEDKIQFMYGLEDQILAIFRDTPADVRFPLIAMIMPFDQEENEFLHITIPRMMIADKTDKTLPPSARYANTFIPTLIPVCNELLNQIAQHGTIVQYNEDLISFRKQEIPGNVPPTGDEKDYLDAIELYDLEIDFYTQQSYAQAI